MESLAVAAVAVAAVALLVVVVLAVQVGRLRRSYDTLVAGEHGTSFVEAMDRQAAAARALRTDVEVLRDDVAVARADLSDVLRHVAVVRYDALGDLAGALSFSAALLDDAGDGLVLTSINGRTETRTYAKRVQGRSSEMPLSPEEQQAIAQAAGTRVDPRAASRP